MTSKSAWCAFLLMAVVFLFRVGGEPAVAENVDPDGDGSQFAYAENVGWINAEPNGDGQDGMQVGDSELSGWLWGENIGWISLSCKNRLSCASTSFGVTNDGNGVLSGHAWAENVGWIDFAPSTAGVTINPATGEFEGYAWGENIGWISFNCSTTASCGEADYKVTTGWICDPPPSPPTGTPTLSLARLGVEVHLSWSTVNEATGYDVLQGVLALLVNSAGDFSAATTDCADKERTTTSLLDTTAVAPGDAAWYLVRGQNCGGDGTCNSGGVAQVADRDAGIASSGICQ